MKVLRMAHAPRVRRCSGLLASTVVAVVALTSTVSGQSAMGVFSPSEPVTGVAVPPLPSPKAAGPGGARLVMGLAQAKTGWTFIQKGNYAAGEATSPPNRSFR